MKKSTLFSLLVIFLLIPATLFLGTRMTGRAYYLTSTLIIIEIMLPFFYAFETRKPQARELVVIAVLCAIGIVGRAAFLAMVVVPGVAWLLARPGAVGRGIDPRVIRGTDALGLAALGTVLIHIAYTYASYRGSGLLAGIQPRYFAFLLPAIWLPAFLLEQRGLPRRLLVTAFTALAIIAFWTSVPNTVAGQARAAENARQAAPRQPPVPVAGLRGHIDSFQFERGRLRVHGWAYAGAGGVPARVAVHVDDAVVHGVETGTERPDVARALGQPGARGAGFEASLELGTAGERECAIGVSATARDGRVTWLRKATCPAPALP